MCFFLLLFFPLPLEEGSNTQRRTPTLVTVTVIAMPVQTSEAILLLCVRRVRRGDEIGQIAFDAKISARAIYRANASFKKSGNVMRWPQGAGRPSVLDHDMIAVSIFLLKL